MASINDARRLIATNNAPRQFGSVIPFTDIVAPYKPESAPMPFAPSPVRSAAYVAERRSNRRANALRVCPSCFIQHPAHVDCD